MYYLIAAAVTKNEGPYLAEWINFHLLQGVEHFYIFDNESEDNTQEVLIPYSYELSKANGCIEDSELTKEDFPVTYIYFPRNPPQSFAYNWAIENLKSKAHWCMFLDIDEMLFSPTNKKVSEVIRDEYDRPHISGITPRWYLFGSNGKSNYEDKPVTERFTKRNTTVDKHCKSIMRLSDTVSMANDPHSFIAINDIVNERLEVMPEHYAIIENQPADILRINHYVTKSKEEYKKRRSTLPDANSGLMKDWKIMFEAHDRNEVECDLILKNIKALKQ